MTEDGKFSLECHSNRLLFHHQKLKASATGQELVNIICHISYFIASSLLPILNSVRLAAPFSRRVDGDLLVKRQASIELWTSGRGLSLVDVSYGLSTTVLAQHIRKRQLALHGASRPLAPSLERAKCHEIMKRRDVQFFSQQIKRSCAVNPILLFNYHVRED